MQAEFNFFQHWYPLSPVEDLDPRRPVPVTLLGIRLVIWKPKSINFGFTILDFGFTPPSSVELLVILDLR
jgi:hypothetical protein